MLLVSSSFLSELARCFSMYNSAFFLSKLEQTTTVRLTSCLTGLDLAKRVNVLWIKHKQSN